MINRLWEIVSGECPEGLKLYFWGCLCLGVAALSLMVVLYRTAEKPAFMDDVKNLIIIIASCIFFFCSGYFLCEWLETFQYTDDQMKERKELYHENRE